MNSPLNKKFGYYSVGNQIFKSKIDAFVTGTKTGVHPKWHFCDDVWGTVNWTQEPETSILDLYKLRAQQIRNSYDRVVIYYSGGCDSQTLVEAFVDAGCFIDEIVTVWHRDINNNPILNTSVTDARNYEAEFELRAKEGIEWIQKISPGTKIVYQDRSGDITKIYESFDGEEWLQGQRDVTNAMFKSRWALTYSRDQLIQLDRGIKTAVVYGVDKPRVCIKDGNYCAYFLDSVSNQIGDAGMNRPEYDNYEELFFYWSPDLPEIVVKQTHMIMKWFEANPLLRPVLAWPNHNIAHRNTYETIVKGLIYPRWDLGNFQVAKPSHSLFCDYDQWFYTKLKDTTAFQVWNKGLDYVIDNVDAKYLQYTFDGMFNGFVGSITDHFVVGPAAPIHNKL